MPSQTTSYENVLKLAQLLEPAQQLQLLEALAGSVRQQVSPRKHRRISELRGLGKEIWQGIDPQRYVKQERAAWNG